MLGSQCRFTGSRLQLISRAPQRRDDINVDSPHAVSHSCRQSPLEAQPRLANGRHAEELGGFRQGERFDRSPYYGRFGLGVARFAFGFDGTGTASTVGGGTGTRNKPRSTLPRPSLEPTFWTSSRRYG